ncbi:MAG: phosphopantothenoylcysteine decarboxylase [Opitutales bacterium]|nr:phosphopantothenoylcysteine decarboxylase [Opitutales bacterium]
MAQEQQPLSGKVLILGVSGSIAAYKAADLARLLMAEGADVHAVMTAGAEKFITPLTLKSLTRNQVSGNLWENHPSWQPPHIELADRADAMLVAPASANLLARIAHGLADDELTAMHLAFQNPLLLAPAMNGKMWHHPATQSNVSLLRDRGAHFIGPEEGMLACGYEGSGRLLAIEKIVAETIRLLA